MESPLPEASTGPGEADEAIRTSRSTLIVTTLALTGTVVAMPQTLVLPLLPELPDLLGTSADNASWLVTSTLLFGTVSIPIVTRLADMVGKKRMMMIALAFMVVGSALGGLSASFALVLIARAMQGVGLSLIPVGIAIMRDELPRERLPLGIALMSATLAVGAGAGLPLSGLIVAHLDWHAIFWVTGIIGAALLVAVWQVLGESPVKTRGSFDYRGAFVATIALTAVMVALSKGAHWGWTSSATLALAVAGLALLVVWVPLELRVRNPLVDVRVAARPAVLLVNVASLLVGFATFANMLMTTQMLQAPTTSGYGRALDVLHTGLWMAPISLMFGVMAPLAARIIRRIGPQVTLVAGALIMAASFIARVYLSSELWQIVAGAVVVAAGTSMTYAAMPTLITRAAPLTETASANGLNTLLRYLGTAAASAAMAAVTTMGMTQSGADVFTSFSALRTVFWVAGAASLIAGLMALPLLRLGEKALATTEQSGRDAVVHGRVLNSFGRPIRHAVVTVVTPAGEPVDWSQVDSAGEFAIAIPGSGRYVAITAAEGWTPQSQLKALVAPGEMDTIVLTERLMIAGQVTSGVGQIGEAVVTLTHQTGAMVRSTRTNAQGLYEMPLPTNGRYVVTAISCSATVTRAVSINGGARIVNLELPQPLKTTPRDVDSPQELLR